MKNYHLIRLFQQNPFIYIYRTFATSVPEIPIAKPISAFFKAGASFVPSPVTATIFYNSFNPVTKRYLSSGVLLAKTNNSWDILSKVYRS